MGYKRDSGVFEEGPSGHHEVPKEGKRLESEIEKVHEGLRKSKKVNKQV
jgi:hypothetical protein